MHAHDVSAGQGHGKHKDLGAQRPHRPIAALFPQFLPPNVDIKMAPFDPSICLVFKKKKKLFLNLVLLVC